DVVFAFKGSTILLTAFLFKRITNDYIISQWRNSTMAF
ncbi:MAG: hypothetical protein ACI89T_000798, partial [Cognaticolwellia sp.]